MTESTFQPNQTKIFHKLELVEDLETCLPAAPHLEYVTDADMQKDLKEVAIKPEYARTRSEFSVEASLLADLLECGNSDQLVQKADSLFTQITELTCENKRAILDEIRPFEQTMRSLHLFFQNAAGGSDVQNAFFMTVDPQYFAGATNPKHFNELKVCLENRYYDWELMESPMYLGYVGDIENGAEDLAKIANQTIAIAAVDVMETSTPEKVIEKLKNRKINGHDEHWGHLVVSGTWLVGRKAYEGIEDEPLYVPSAAAIVGKMMAVHEGSSIGGFENGALTGIKGVRYDAKKYVNTGSDTRDSALFRENGMVIIGWRKGGAYILGDATAACESDNEDLKKVSQMMVYNGIMKDLLQHCNNKAYSTWGKDQKKAFKEQLENYLNDCIRRRKIQGYANLEVIDINADEVEIRVEIIYFQTRSQYNIKITGKKDRLDLATKPKS